MNTDKNMTDNKMTPEQLIKQWLPEYEQRLSDYVREVVGASSDIGLPYVAEVEFDSMYFSDALAAYTDHIRKEACEKQKEECAEAWHYAIAGIGEPYYESINKAIRNAPAPEFKITEKE